MTLADTIYDIGSPSHKLAMRSLKPFSGLGSGAYNEFWPAWTTINAHRRAEIAHAMVDLAEDNVDLDFAQALLWLLDDDDAEVRATAAEGLWESERSLVLEGLLRALQSDPAAPVRAAAAMSLSRFAYRAEMEELSPSDDQALRAGLERAVLDARQPIDVRRRALESAGYFASNDAIQEQVAQAYSSSEQLLRESALVAMGRSLLPRWLPNISQALSASSPALRYEAARAAGEMSEDARSLLPKVAPLLNDKDSEVALAAIWALGQIGGETAQRLLKQVAKEGDDARRQAAADALDELMLGDSLV
jgi:hypothetical protein